MVSSWYAQLDRAKSIVEVVGIARDFLATWTPSELALLPPNCRPGRLRDEQDIEALHSCLVEEYRVSRASGQDLDALQRLTSFVVRVSIRLAEIGSGDASSATGAGPGEGTEKSLAPRRG